MNTRGRNSCATAFLLILIMILTAVFPILTVPAYAANNNNTVDVSTAPESIVITKSGDLHIAKAGNLVIATGDSIILTGTTTTNNVTVSGAGIFNVILSEASIRIPDFSTDAALSSSGDAKLNLILESGTTNTIESKVHRAGIETGDRGLTISGIGNGTLYVYGGGGGAAIGGGSASGGYSETGKNISITGEVNIIASSAAFGAAIGGGLSGNGENITISGDANVKATGGFAGGAGIGGGFSGSGRNITISGNADVTTIGTGGGAGVGGGLTRDGTEITIAGNTNVTATCDSDGAGIGGGRSGTGSGIIICDNAKVQTTGGSRSTTSGGAGIGGGGNKGIGNDITITDDADIQAIGGNRAAGIGGGSGSIGEDITISGNAEVIATGGGLSGSGGAGIGGGINGTGAGIKIFGEAIVKASSGSYAAGIGGGSTGIGKSIDIHGEATVTSKSRDRGAGIGGGNNKNGADITISGSAIVMADGGDYGAGIGSGNAMVSNNTIAGKDITIAGESTVNATGGLNGGAGIGGGAKSKGELITISGEAKVIANSKNSSAGIGGGTDGIGKDITISEKAIVTASAVNGGSGIGGGTRATGEGITISGEAKVIATGGHYSAGIGGGSMHSGKNILISGDVDIIATGGLQGAGIGGGGNNRGSGYDITISGNANVTATGGQGGAGIGGGSGTFMDYIPGDARDIVIEGGFVTAKAGTTAAGMAPAYDIGAGSAKIGGRTTTEGITISGGSVFALHEDTAFGTTPKSIDGKDVFKVTVPAIYSISGFVFPGVSLLGNKFIDIDLPGGAKYFAKTVSSGACEHGASFPSGASAFLYLPKGDYEDIEVGEYIDAEAEVVTSSMISSSLQNIIRWSNFKITPSSVTIPYGESVTINTITQTPADDVSWDVDYGNIISSTSYSAVIKPTTVGAVRVTATSIHNSNIYANATIQVTKATPIIVTNPSASSINVRQHLSDSALTAGAVSVAGIGNITGTFTWADPTTVANRVGVHPYLVIFTPDEPEKYTTTSAMVNVKVERIPQPPGSQYITINGILVPYTLSGDTIIIDIDNNYANDLFTAAGAGNIFVDAGQLNDDLIERIEFTFTDISGIDSDEFTGLTLLLGSGKSVTYSVENMREVLRSMIRFTLDGSSANDDTEIGIISVPAPGGSADYYSYLAPKHIEIPYTLKPGEAADNLVVVDSDGKIIPRSWYKDGKVCAQVYSEGTYEVLYNAPKEFSDVTAPWMKTPINYMCAREAITGTGNGKFNPTGNITREDFVVIIMRTFSLDATKIEGTAKIFNDEDAISNYAKEHIDVASKLDIIQGDSKGNFNPKSEITREEVFTIMSRAAKKMGIITEPVSGTVPNFKDWNQVSKYAKPEIEDLSKLGLVKGSKGYIKPHANATRAEATQLIYNVLRYEI